MDKFPGEKPGLRSPGNTEPIRLRDLIDIPQLQSMMDNFFNLCKIPTAIINTDGEVLAGSGWQNICTRFHRIHPETNKNCIESDTLLTTGIPEGEFKLYKCKNGMWDLATPIIVDGKHLGNLFMGQFFFDNEIPDKEFFRQKALHFGFNEKEYLKALDEVPRLNHANLDNAKAFFIKLANSISQLSYSNIRLARLLQERNGLMESLRQSEERFRNLFEKTKAVMLLIDPVSGDIIDANLSAEIFYGWTHTQLCNMNIQDINMLSKEQVMGERMAALAEKRNYFIFPHRRADNSIKWVEVYSSPVKIDREQKLFSIIHDITERKKFEDKLMEREENIRAILDATQETITMYDKKGNIIIANRTATRRINRPLEEIIGRNITEVFPYENSEKHLKHNNEVFASGKPVRFEDELNGMISIHNLYPVFENDQVVGIVCYNQDVTSFRVSEKLIDHLASFPKLNPNPVIEIDLTGTITFFNTAAANTLIQLNSAENIELYLPEDIQEIITFLHRSHGNKSTEREVCINNHTFSESIHYIKELKVLRLYIMDITEHKKAEDQLRKLSGAVEQSANSIIITDVNGLIEYVNPEFTRISGYTLQEIKGQNPRILKSGKNNPDLYKALWETITNGRQWHGSFLNRKKSGELYWESVNVSPIFCNEGTITHFVAVKEDITGTIKYEEQLNRLNRTLNALRHNSEAINTAVDEQSYLNEVCRIIVKDCGHKLVWIGFAENDINKSIKPVASAGFEEGYLDTLNITWADTKLGQGPTGRTVRTGNVSVCNDILNDEKFKPWRYEAIKRGYASSFVIPIKKNGVTFGAISIYSGEVQVFSEDEINLLSELAENLVYGIDVIRTRNTQKKVDLGLYRVYINSD